MDRPALRTLHFIRGLYKKQCCRGYWNGAGYECAEWCECVSCTSQREAVEESL